MLWIWIRIQHLKHLNPDPVWIQGFDYQIKKEKTEQPKFFLSFLDQKLQFTYPEASLKDVQNIGEAFSPQKKTSST
jgi:hypothetical protein